MRRRLLLIVIACSAVLPGCSPGAASTPARPAAVATASPVPPAEPSCSWYTPETGPAYGQVVTVTAHGPACRSQALIRWIAVRSGRPWAPAPAAPGTMIIQMGKDGTVIQIWQDGWAQVTDQTAGYLADDFTAAGWIPQPPRCPQAGCGPAVPIADQTGR